jgi:nucleoside-diphosphate-sugar epimerase
MFPVRAPVGAHEGVRSLRGKPAPLTRDVLQIVGRYAWYDTAKARTELGWSSRPLRETLSDTIRWLQNRPSGAPASSTREHGAAVR